MADYDHHKKAGNQGDIVKHPALVAAVDAVLDARQPIVQVCGRLRRLRVEPLGSRQRMVGRHWENRRTPRPQGEPACGAVGRMVRPAHTASNWPERYPSSVRIVADLCRDRRIPVELALWDISDAAIQSLNHEFGGQGHAILQQPFDYSDISTSYVRDADFVFFDPPDKAKNWKSVRRFLSRKSRRNSRPLVWLAIGADTTATPPNEDAESVRIRETVLAMPGFGVTKVRWASGGRTIGCQLVYHLVPAAVGALTKAVDCIVEVAHLEPSERRGRAFLCDIPEHWVPHLLDCERKTK